MKVLLSLRTAESATLPVGFETLQQVRDYYRKS